MPRPCKRRRICALPSICQFGPKTAADTASFPVFMTLDEFERPEKDCGMHCKWTGSADQRRRLRPVQWTPGQQAGLRTPLLERNSGQEDRSYENCGNL